MLGRFFFFFFLEEVAGKRGDRDNERQQREQNIRDVQGCPLDHQIRTRE